MCIKRTWRVFHFLIMKNFDNPDIAYIVILYKLYKTFKSVKQHLDKEFYKQARKKNAYFEEKLKENAANPKKH